MIRSVFSGGGSTSVTQPLGELIEGFSQGRFRLYGELVRR
jgi:hypothetical protein